MADNGVLENLLRTSEMSLSRGDGCEVYGNNRILAAREQLRAMGPELVRRVVNLQGQIKDYRAACSQKQDIINCDAQIIADLRSELALAEENLARERRPENGIVSGTKSTISIENETIGVSGLYDGMENDTASTMGA